MPKNVEMHLVGRMITPREKKTFYGTVEKAKGPKMKIFSSIWLGILYATFAAIIFVLTYIGLTKRWTKAILPDPVFARPAKISCENIPKEKEFAFSIEKPTKTSL